MDSPDPSHIVTEFMEAIEELEVPVHLDDDERYPEPEYHIDPQTGWEER